MKATVKEQRLQTQGRAEAYGSVGDLMRGVGITQQAQDEVESLRQSSRVVDMLASMRHASGVTQEVVAKELGVTQSAISKVESGKDEDLSLNVVLAYASACGTRVQIQFGKQMTHVEAVKEHALQIKEHLTALAALAHQDEEIEQAVRGFFGEAFINLLIILARCQGEMPPAKKGGIRFRVSPAARRGETAVTAANESLLAAA